MCVGSPRGKQCDFRRSSKSMGVSRCEGKPTGFS